MSDLACCHTSKFTHPTCERCAIGHRSNRTWTATKMKMYLLFVIYESITYTSIYLYRSSTVLGRCMRDSMAYTKMYYIYEKKKEAKIISWIRWKDPKVLVEHWSSSSISLYFLQMLALLFNRMDPFEYQPYYNFIIICDSRLLQLYVKCWT